MVEAKLELVRGRFEFRGEGGEGVLVTGARLRGGFRVESCRVCRGEPGAGLVARGYAGAGTCHALLYAVVVCRVAAAFAEPAQCV